jgi:hypothetical protein
VRAAVLLKRGGIDGFIQNARVRLPSGKVRVIDFYWPALRACLEIESIEWHSEPGDWSATWDRHLELAKLGFSVIHRPPSALRDAGRFVADVREWLAERARAIA